MHDAEKKTEELASATEGDSVSPSFYALHLCRSACTSSTITVDKEITQK
jgi:hypothetical protein